MRQSLVLASLLATALAPSALSQVDVFEFASMNTGTIVDFDAPAATLGPIAANDPFFTSAGIAEVNVFGTWTTTGDLLTSVVFGQSLAYVGGQLTVSQSGDPMDNPDAGAGFEIVLTNSWDEIGVLFTDQGGFTYDVEMFDGATSLGTATSINTFGSPAHFRAASKANRVVITFPTGTGGVGLDDIFFADGPGFELPLPINCVETTLLGGNGGSAGGAVYFDLTVTQDVDIDEILANYDPATEGALVGIEMWTTPGTRVGVETDPTAWTLAGTDDGAAISGVAPFYTPINLAAPVTLTAGSWGIALVAVGASWDYSNGAGLTTFESADGVMSLTAGGASNVPFTGAVFEPRLFNGRLCRAGGDPVGSNYCVAEVNESGAAASMAAGGSVAVTDNDLTLYAFDVPAGQTGLFVCSLGQAFFQAGTFTNGNVCVDNQIGRFNQPGQVVMADASGRMSLTLDLNEFPQGASLVPVAVGETWYFQAWFRETVGLGSNFTDGLEVVFN